MIWDIINSIGRVLLTAVAVVLVTHLRHMLNLAERSGLGLAGAGSFLTVTVIWENNQSPFDGWSVTMLTYGALLFFCGFAYRKLRHDRANTRAVIEAQRYLRSRGKQ